MIDSGRQFKLVSLSLFLSPSILAVTLLLGESLVLLLQGLELGILSAGGLIFKHASHASYGGGLLSIVLSLLLLGLVMILMLGDLLFDPCLLLGSLVRDTVLV